MNKRLRFIILLTICIILGNQFVHLYQLYKIEQIQYIHRQNELINGTLYEFGMKHTDVESFFSFNASTNKLIYVINHKKKSFQLNTKDDIRQISQRSRYDIRNPRSWTLKNFYTYLQAKQDSTQIKTLSLQLAIQDSTGQITASYPAYLETLPLFPEYREPLGFISDDTLYATYDFPLLVFIRSAIGQIILTIIISALLIVCTINLWQTIRNEKKRGEYRELFIHNLVHDLKRPVANQIKTCYLLREVPPEESVLLLEQSQQQLNEMLQSINRMLLQSTDAHELRLNIREIDLREMLEASAQPDRWNRQTDKQVDIQVDFRPENPVITGDDHFLFAVFQNFIDNAFKYSGKQVKIQITCTEPDTRHLQVRIKDNGFGISSKNLKHVFERYHRGDQQDNRKIKGHGQGLYYARTVILAHGGEIGIESEEGKGTTVIVTLARESHIKKKYK